MVDAAVALQKRGHEVELFTSFHEDGPNGRSFEETRDGQSRVTAARLQLARDETARGGGSQVVAGKLPSQPSADSAPYLQEPFEYTD